MRPPQAQETSRKRVRMKPEARSRLILDAALIEFSRHGYTATRIEDIAARAGLTKTGVYGHYKSKDAIFEALLSEMMAPPESPAAFCWDASGKQSLEALVDGYIEQMYRKLNAPNAQRIFRLLLTESERVPDAVGRWFTQLVLQSRLEEQSQVDECVRRGVMRKSPVTDLFTLTNSPVLMWMVSNAVFRDATSLPLDKVRDIHRHMLLELLRPR